MNKDKIFSREFHEKRKRGKKSGNRINKITHRNNNYFKYYSKQNILSR